MWTGEPVALERFQHGIEHHGATLEHVGELVVVHSLITVAIVSKAAEHSDVRRVQVGRCSEEQPSLVDGCVRTRRGNESEKTSKSVHLRP